MSTKLKFITTNSWLVISDTDERVGLLTAIENRYTLMVRDVKQKFSSKEEVNKFFKEDVFSNIVTTEITTEIKTDCFIKGYPVDWATPHEVFIAGNKLPLYSKKESSEVYFSAGYYCLDFPKMWMPAFSPKLTTLQTYNYLGPFTTEGEMKLMLNKARKERNERNKQTRTQNKEF